MRWSHLSLTALDASTSSERQVIHSTLKRNSISTKRGGVEHGLAIPSFHHLFLDWLGFCDGFWLLRQSRRPHE